MLQGNKYTIFQLSTSVPVLPYIEMITAILRRN
jgi:hypothetical protein